MNKEKYLDYSVETQTIGLRSVRNARELGGYPVSDGRKVKRGFLLRTARLSTATAADIDRLSKFFHVGTIIDFRMRMERASDPNPDIPGASYHPIDILDEDVMQAKAQEIGFFSPSEAVTQTDILTRFLKSGVVSDQMYVEFIETKRGQAGYRRFFELILDTPADKAVLWHCTSGKDRTGVAAMLLLCVLGANEELIVHDYLLTNQFNDDAISKQRQALVLEGADPALLSDMLAVRYAVNESYLRNAIAFLKSAYGSVSAYVTDVLGLSQDALLELRNRYLE